MRVAWVLAGLAMLVAVVVTAVNSGLTAIFARSGVLVVALVYPWFARRDTEFTRTAAACLSAVLLIAGIPWAVAWFGLGVFALPVVVLAVYGYGRAVRAGVEQARRPTPDSPSRSKDHLGERCDERGLDSPVLPVQLDADVAVGEQLHRAAGQRRCDLRLGDGAPAGAELDRAVVLGRRRDVGRRGSTARRVCRRMSVAMIVSARSNATIGARARPAPRRPSGNQYAANSGVAIGR